MAGKRIVIPNYMPALDLNGNPVAGAKLYFYENETTTLKAIYTSAGLSVQHPNPISANAAGVFASIFADDAEEFSVAITDADDLPITGLRNRDNITPSLAFLDGVEAPVSDVMADVLAEDTLAEARTAMGVVGSTALAAASGAALVGHKRAEASAVARTLQDVLREQVSVAEWGALPNNVDCQAAIQAAFNEAPLGCDLWFPPGPDPDYAYRVDGPLVLNRKMNLRSAGGRLLGYFIDNFDDDLLHINPTDAYDLDARNWIIEGFRAFTFQSGGRNVIRISDDGANTAQIGWVIRNSVIGALDGSAGHAIRIDTASPTYGVHVATIQDCQISNGIYHAGADSINILRNNIFGTKPGIIVDLPVGSGAFKTRIRDNTFSARDGAVQVLHGDEGEIVGNHIEQGGAFGANTSTHKAQVAFIGSDAGEPIRDWLVKRNNFGAGGNCEAAIVLASHTRDIIIDENVLRLGTLNAVNKDIRILASTCEATRIGDKNVYRGTRTPADVGDPGVVEDSGVATRGLWKTAALQNSWTGATFRFRPTLDRKVAFSGRLTPGTLTATTLVCTLPVGCRPKDDAVLMGFDIGNTVANAFAVSASTGEVTVLYATGGAVSLDGVVMEVQDRATYESGVV